MLKKSSKLCWVLTDGSAGMENQAWGLGESLGYNVIIKRISLRQPWRLLSPYFQLYLKHCLKKTSFIHPPWPDLIIACGRQSVLPALHIKRISRENTISIYLQDPKISPKNFDIVLCPKHDKLQGPNVIRMIGAPHRVTKKQLEENHKKFEPVFSKYPGPRYSILIGGSNKVYTLSENTAVKIATKLKALQKKDAASLLITFSRRTSPEVISSFYYVFKNIPNVYIWNFKGENPYFALLSWGDAILLTCDSVSMISEVCSTAKPVHLIRLPGTGRKFNLFHESLLKMNRIKWFNGHVDTSLVKPFDETANITKQIKFLLNKG